MLHFLKQSLTLFFHCFGKCSRDKLRSKTYLSSGVNMVKQAFIIKPIIRPSAIYVVGIRPLRAFQVSNSEIGCNRRK